MPFFRFASTLFLLATALVAPAAAADPTPAAPAPAAARAERLSYAIVIGSNKSLGRRRPELRYADDDAARYYEILETMAPGRVTLLADFDRDTAQLFPGTQPHALPPTRRNLETAGRRVAAEVRAARAAGHETEVYFVFAGHGDVERGEGFVELADGRFRSRELEAFLRGIPFSHAHVLLDSCNSFFMLGVRKPGGRHFATSEDAARALAERLPNVGVFLSTSADGEAFEWSEIQSGIFSHVVRSGLLGAADANADGSVSYLELAGFVATATADVKNPNMRPRVFARGPGAQDHTPIARLSSMAPIRRFELGDASALRLRLRDANGLPLLDAHTEPTQTLALRVPEAWARGATIERSASSAAPGAGAPRRFYTVPDAPETVTLAALQDLTARSAGRGPEETFQSLFARPFGPTALAHYEKDRAAQSPRVYGVSREDAQRMDLVLDQLSRTERGRRITEAMGGIGFGLLTAGAGAAILAADEEISSLGETEAKVLGGSLLGLGGLFVLGGTGSLFDTTTGERAAAEFRSIVNAGGDPAQAFAVANQHLEKLSKQRQAERYAEGIIGSVVVLGSTTGLVWSEVASNGEGDRTLPRLGWSAGIVGGALMIGDALLTETPVDTITRIWRDDPSLNQYQYRPAVSVTPGGAFFTLSGTL